VHAAVSSLQLVPLSASSAVFGSAQVAGAASSVALAANDYVEQEFFVSGTANVYEHDAAEQLAVKSAAVPYVTRIIVRRPQSATRFSGVVVLEPIHPSMAGTLSWAANHAWLMRKGHAYVAIGTGDDASSRELSRSGAPVAADLLAQWFDPVRYEGFRWPQDDGVRWDVMTDIAQALRGPALTNPLGQLPVRTAVAVGWSFTGSLWRTFINEGFHERARRAGGRPAVDGYLIGISSRWNGGGYIALNSDSAALPVTHARRALKTIDAPVIEFLTANEVASGTGPQMPDRDGRSGGHRLYELGATNHGDSFDVAIGGRNQRTNMAQLRARDYPFPPGSDRCELDTSDVPVAELASAALDNLVRWAGGGAAPPRAPRLGLTLDGGLRRDAFGNPVGGIRIAEFDVPRARYDIASASERDSCPKPATRNPYYRFDYDADWLQGRYGSVPAYVSAYEKRSVELVKQRWLLPEDAARLVAKARDEAQRMVASASAGPTANTAARFGHYAPAKVFTEQVTSTLYLPMRDGVRLAVLVARPARNGKAVAGRFPVIWQHALTIYPDPADGIGPRAGGYRTLPHLTDYGYVVAQVARRGNGQSFGARRGYHDRSEAYDAYEVTEWLAAQDWSNGVVGIYGCSNTGDAALHAMTSRPPHLKAAFAGCFSWNKYDAMRRGGIFAQWGTGPQRSLAEDMTVPPIESDVDRKLLSVAAQQHQQSTVLYDLWKSMPFRDSYSPLVASRFWGEGSASNYADQLRQSGVALYIQGAWNDEFRDQGLVTFLNIPGSRALIGPWKHCENPGFALGNEVLRFFDQQLKGIDTGLQHEPAIHYYTVNAPAGSEWRTTSSWPVTGAVPQRWYLQGGQRLAGTVPAASTAASFKINTGVSCPNAGSGSTVQPCHVKSEGLSFATAALTSDTEVTGDPLVQLRVVSDRGDANVFGYLEDVAPDGAITVVTEGRLKSSLRATNAAPYRLPVPVWHRAYAEDQQPVATGAAMDLSFAMLPASYVFKAGHRMQLTVTGADHRERDRDPAVDGTMLSVPIDPSVPSYLELPTVTSPGSLPGGS
jgi:putative CocE/NonD family hydrolase